MLFLMVLPHVLFCYIGLGTLALITTTLQTTRFARVTGRSCVLSSIGPSMIHLAEVFLPTLNLLDLHSDFFVELEMLTISGDQPTLDTPPEQLGLLTTINPLVAPLRRRMT